MKPIKDMSAEELAAFVCTALGDAGIKVTLTGGACVAIWTDGQYMSKDLDFVEQGTVPRRELRAVLVRLGFSEDSRYFTHPDTEYVIEFPSGPFAVGNEPVKAILERVSATGVLRLLSPSDCVKDRLAAFFHWSDQQALRQAVMVARMQPIDFDEVRRWSTAEGMASKFEQFLAACELAK
jgi:hypothetical protein